MLPILPAQAEQAANVCCSAQCVHCRALTIMGALLKLPCVAGTVAVQWNMTTAGVACGTKQLYLS